MDPALRSTTAPKAQLIVSQAAEPMLWAAQSLATARLATTALREQTNHCPVEREHTNHLNSQTHVSPAQPVTTAMRKESTQIFCCSRSALQGTTAWTEQLTQLPLMALRVGSAQKVTIALKGVLKSSLAPEGHMSPELAAPSVSNVLQVGTAQKGLSGLLFVLRITIAQKDLKAQLSVQMEHMDTIQGCRVKNSAHGVQSANIAKMELSLGNALLDTIAIMEPKDLLIFPNCVLLVTTVLKVLTILKYVLLAKLTLKEELKTRMDARTAKLDTTALKMAALNTSVPKAITATMAPQSPSPVPCTPTSMKKATTLFTHASRVLLATSVTRKE